MMLYVRTYHSNSMVNNSTKWVQVLCWIRRTELAQMSSNQITVKMFVFQLPSRYPSLLLCSSAQSILFYLCILFELSPRVLLSARDHFSLVPY